MRTYLNLALIFCLGLFLLAGCGSEESSDYEGYATAEVAAQSPEADFESYAADSDGIVLPASANAGLPANDTSDPATAPSATIQRRIIYNADIDLVVDDFAGVQSKVADLANTYGGFVASSNVYGSEGSPRRGQWTLRIPSAQYNDLVKDSESLGQIRSTSSNTQEVTAEFVDLQARLSNLRTEEQRLHRHLEESTGSLEDILRVEREISRVRGDTERIEGRLNVLRDLTTLSTVTLRIEEIRNYVPEPTEEPGFGQQVARTWSDSVDAVAGFFTSLSLITVALTPWLVVIIPLSLVAFLIARWLRRLTRQPKPATATQERR